MSEQSVQWRTRRLGARAHDHFRDAGCPAGLALGELLTSVVTADRFSAVTYAPGEIDAARLVENMNWSLSSSGAPDRRRRGPSPMAWVIAGASNAWAQIAVVTRAELPTDKLSRADLEAVAGECTQVVQGVYDQESWLVLDRKLSTPAR